MSRDKATNIIRPWDVRDAKTIKEVSKLKHLLKKTNNVNKQKFSKEVGKFFKFYEHTRRIIANEECFHWTYKDYIQQDELVNMRINQ